MTAVPVLSQLKAPCVHRLCTTFSQSYWEQSLTAYIWTEKTQKFVDRAERKVTTNPKLGQNNKSRSTEEDLLLCFECFTATLRVGGGCMKWWYVFQWDPRKIWIPYRATSWSTMAANKARCKCAAANFPCTVEEFESSSRLSVSCCSFISVTTRMTSALGWATMRAILMFHNCEGQSHKTVFTDHNFWRVIL